MGTAAEYRKQAEECRKLARQSAVPADRRVFEEIAETWEMLANLSAHAIDDPASYEASTASEDL